MTCAVFSHDSSLVATGDMSGMIKAWKVETKEEIWSFEVGDLEVRGRECHPETLPQPDCVFVRLFSLCICKHLCEVFYWG